MIKKNIILALIALAFLQSCQENKPADTETNVEANLLSPDFDADSAYAYTKAQVDFGPRIPSTEAHARLDNLNNIDKNTLKAVGQTVLETIYREKFGQ